MDAPEYSTEKLIFDIPMDKAIETAMDIGMCRRACASCPFYGRLWSCPPFVTDTDAQHPERYDTLRLIVTHISLARRCDTSRLSEIFHRIKRALIPGLAEQAALKGGVLYGFAGQCDFCDKECTRLSGKPCRHPRLAGPSLEGVGFNVGALLETFCGLSLQWDSPTLTYVAGIACNITDKSLS